MDEIPERVLKRVDFGMCWLWTGGKTDGYGTFRNDEGSNLVHRFVWETLVGEIPRGLQLDHLCLTRLCCNPDHLEQVTHQQNCSRRVDTKQQYVCDADHQNCNQRICKRGHLGEYVREVSGAFSCRGCQRELWHERGAA